MTAKDSNAQQRIARSELSHEQETSLSHELTPLSVKTLWDEYYQKSESSRAARTEKSRQTGPQGSRKK